MKKEELERLLQAYDEQLTRGRPDARRDQAQAALGVMQGLGLVHEYRDRWEALQELRNMIAKVAPGGDIDDAVILKVLASGQHDDETEAFAMLCRACLESALQPLGSVIGDRHIERNENFAKLIYSLTQLNSSQKLREYVDAIFKHSHPHEMAAALWVLVLQGKEITQEIMSELAKSSHPKMLAEVITWETVRQNLLTIPETFALCVDDSLDHCLSRIGQFIAMTKTGARLMGNEQGRGSVLAIFKDLPYDSIKFFCDNFSRQKPLSTDKLPEIVTKSKQEAASAAARRAFPNRNQIAQYLKEYDDKKGLGRTLFGDADIIKNLKVLRDAAIAKNGD